MMVARILRWRLLLLIVGTCPIALVCAENFPEPYNTEPGDPQPMPAEEAAETAKLPPGFRLEVFAADPDVQQPFAICFDGKNRLWMAECYTYAEQPRRWDVELNDRIVVLEDLDGDGRSDSRTVFWDQGIRLTSIAHGRGGIWALCAPNLLFLPDRDGDLVPDGEREVVLEGFDAENIGRNIVNGLKWGPDGWLYGRHGIAATSDAVVPADFRMTVFNLKDGRVITGVIAEQSEKSLTVQTPSERFVLGREQIESSQTLPMSMMPEGLLGAMDQESVRNLIAFLTGNRKISKSDSP